MEGPLSQSPGSQARYSLFQRLSPSRTHKIALAIYIVVTLLFFLSTASERLASHTPFNHFALLAECWRNGRLDLGGPPPAYTGNNDFALFQGRYYVSFPPFPALLLMPALLVRKSAEHVRDGLVFLGLSGIAPAVLFLALENLRKRGRNPRSEGSNIALSLLFATASVYWFSSVQGTVWFAAHVVGAALAALYIQASIGARFPMLAGLFLGLGFATRTPLGFAFPFFVYEALRAHQRTPLPEGSGLIALLKNTRADIIEKSLLPFAVAPSLVLSLLLWHNAARFGNAFEFGHGLLDIAWRGRIEKWGLFSYHYLARNLGVLLTSMPFIKTPGAPFQINAHGLALWITTPIFAWAVWPKQTGALFKALALSALMVALPSLLYQNSGWIQFGYRFSNDFSPFLFVMIALGARRFSAPFWLLGAFAIAVNAFGALSFQRTGFDRFYFLDRTQKILHQPD